MAFKLKDYETLKKDFEKQVPLLVASHGKSELADISVDRQANVRALRTVIELLDKSSHSAAVKARVLTGALLLTKTQIYQTYIARSAKNSYWYTITDNLVGVSEENPLTNNDKAGLYTTLHTFLGAHLLVDGKKDGAEYNKFNAFSKIVAFDPLAFWTLCVNEKAILDQAMPGAAKAKADAKAAAEAAAEAAARPGFLGRFFGSSKPAPAAEAPAEAASSSLS